MTLNIKRLRYLDTVRTLTGYSVSLVASVSMDISQMSQQQADMKGFSLKLETAA